jgi:hypothetical protein
MSGCALASSPVEPAPSLFPLPPEEGNAHAAELYVVCRFAVPYGFRPGTCIHRARRRVAEQGRRIVRPRKAALLAGLFVSVMAGVASVGGTGALAANPPTPAISEEANAAVARMGTTLQAKEFSFQAHTLRVYAHESGELLHIAHTFKVTVRRPDRLLVDGSGDDGPRKLIYDGKTAVMVLDDGKKYASLPVPDTIEGMLQVVVGHFGVDFPLADLLTNDPRKSFLLGVVSGHQVNTVTIDGVVCRHLLFSQPPKIELELWLEDNAQSLPRRLIVTYRSLPGEPNFVAEMSDWNFSVHPSDAEFQFTPPPGAERLTLGAAVKQATGAK